MKKNLFIISNCFLVLAAIALISVCFQFSYAFELTALFYMISAVTLLTYCINTVHQKD